VYLKKTTLERFSQNEWNAEEDREGFLGGGAARENSLRKNKETYEAGGPQMGL